MKFGDYLRQKREKTGWTQPEAAARADIEQSYLSKLETGKSYPSEDIFARLIDIYSIDLDELGRAVYAAELDKLRDIRQVRTMLLTRDRAQAGFIRSWLIAGLVMIMIGGGALGLAYAVPDGHMRYLYRSEGVIHKGEPPMIFQLMAAGAPDSDNKTFNDRIDYAFKNLGENRGPSFIEQVEGGYRQYSLYDKQAGSRPSAISWHYALGLMFLMGGLACFYISRRWR